MTYQDWLVREFEDAVGWALANIDPEALRRAYEKYRWEIRNV